MTITVTGIDATLTQADRDFERLADIELRTRTFNATNDARLATPVDTGRARNSWRVDKQGEDLTTRLDRYRVRNIVNYIEDLNMGTSRQAPANFIEESFLRYFDEVAVQVYHDPLGGQDEPGV